MMSSKSKNKGSAFEREVCKYLSRWWTNDDRDDVFWRTDTSGGRATVRSKKGVDTYGQYGDICCRDPIGKPFLDVLTPELKVGYKDVSIIDIVDVLDSAGRTQWEKWFEQAYNSHRAAKSCSWALITKRHSKSPLIFFDELVYFKMDENEMLHYRPDVQLHLDGIIQIDISEYTDQKIFGMRLYEWHECIKNDYDSWVELAECLK